MCSKVLSGGAVNVELVRGSVHHAMRKGSVKAMRVAVETGGTAFALVELENF